MQLTENKKGNYKEVKEKEVVNDLPKETAPTPPDGGWGWVVVFSSFMIHVIADGVTYTIGIFYVAFLQYFHSSKGTTAWVASIMVGTTFCIGPFASALMNKYGCRTVAIAGALIATFGLVISTFAPNVIFLFFSIGLCAGLGFGLMYVPAIVCVTCYFEKRRAFATGIAVCGSGFGTFAMAPLTEILMESYEWKGAMLVVAGMVLNCVIFGALFRPLEAPKVKTEENVTLEMSKSVGSVISSSSHPIDFDSHQRFVSNRKRNDSTCSEKHEPEPFLPNGSHARSAHTRPVRSCSDAAYINRPLLQHKVRENGGQPVVTSHHDLRQLRRSSSPHHPDHNGPLYRKDVFYSGSLMNIPEYRSDPVQYNSSVVSLPKKTMAEQRGLWSSFVSFFRCSEEIKDVFVQMTDTTLLRDPVFLMFGISNFFTNIGFNVPFVYTKDRALDMGIAEDEDASLLLSIIGIANTGGRIILGYLSDKSWVNRLYLYNLCLTLCGIATALSAFCTTYPLMGVYSAVFGVTAGAYVSLTSVILVDLLGLDKLTNAFGLLLLFEGVACLVGPPITGWLYDGFGSYDPGFYVCGVMIAISGLMLFAIPFVQKRTSSSANTTLVREDPLSSPTSV